MLIMESITDYVHYSGYYEDDKQLEELKESSLPLLIYGFGNSGQVLLEFLKCNGISVEGAFVDDVYYNTSGSQLIRVYKKSEVGMCFDKYNVIVGMVNYSYALQSLKEMKGNVRTFYLQNPYRYLESEMITWDYFIRKKEEFQKSFEYFEDEISKKIFVAYLNTVINKNYKYLLGYEGCKTYFNQELVNLTHEESFVDAGAYNGDSLSQFFNSTSFQYKDVYAIEPDKKNFLELSELINKSAWERVHLINLGVWNKKDILRFSANNQQESSILDGKKDVVGYEEISVDTLDHILHGKEVSFIKLSVQGAELEALQGADNILQNQRPKLAMTIFMRKNALISIPQMMKEKYPFYKLYLRCEEPFWARVILYAIPSHLCGGMR